MFGLKAGLFGRILEIAPKQRPSPFSSRGHRGERKKIILVVFWAHLANSSLVFLKIFYCFSLLVVCAGGIIVFGR